MEIIEMQDNKKSLVARGQPCSNKKQQQLMFHKVWKRQADVLWFAQLKYPLFFTQSNAKQQLFRDMHYQGNKSL